MKKGKDDWEKKMEEEATKETAREKARSGGGNKISIRKSRFSFGGEFIDKDGRSMRCVVVDFVYLRSFYKSKFKEDAPGIPTCFALSETGEEMKPHANSPKKQNKTCDGCPKAEWGSANYGKSQACKDRRRLAILHADDMETAEDVADANIAVLEIPVTSLAKWKTYIDSLKEKTKRPYYAVVSKLAFDRDESYPVVTFELEEKIGDKEIVDAIVERREEIREMLMQPYEGEDRDDDEDENEDEDERPAKKSKKPVKKTRDEDEDDEDEDDDEGDDDEDDDEPPRNKKRGKSSKDDDDDDDEDDDKDDDEEDAPPRKKRSKTDESDDDEEDDDDEDEEDEEDEKPAKKRGSRFGRK